VSRRQDVPGAGRWPCCGAPVDPTHHVTGPAERRWNRQAGLTSSGEYSPEIRDSIRGFRDLRIFGQDGGPWPTHLGKEEARRYDESSKDQHAVQRGAAAHGQAAQYFRLRPIFFLEDGVYGSIDTAKRIAAACPVEQPLAVVEIYHVPGDRNADGHAAFLE